jgi:hypothetical protein
MVEKFGKMKCKTMSFEIYLKVLIHFSLYKFQKHNCTIQRRQTPYSTMKTQHIKRNSIVQIEIFIAYKTKLF